MRRSIFPIAADAVIVPGYGRTRRGWVRGQRVPRWGTMVVLVVLVAGLVGCWDGTPTTDGTGDTDLAPSVGDGDTAKEDLFIGGGTGTGNPSGVVEFEFRAGNGASDLIAQALTLRVGGLALMGTDVPDSANRAIRIQSMGVSPQPLAPGDGDSEAARGDAANEESGSACPRRGPGVVMSLPHSHLFTPLRQDDPTLAISEWPVRAPCAIHFLAQGEASTAEAERQTGPFAPPMMEIHGVDKHGVPWAIRLGLDGEIRVVAKGRGFAVRGGNGNPAGRSPTRFRVEISVDKLSRAIDWAEIPVDEAGTRQVDDGVGSPWREALRMALPKAIRVSVVAEDGRVVEEAGEGD